jgi:hypothetical protein
MKLPIQAQPITRTLGIAKVSDGNGVNPSATYIDLDCWEKCKYVPGILKAGCIVACTSAQFSGEPGHGKPLA